MPEATRSTADLVRLDCRTCGAELVLEPHLRTVECPYCASPNVVERPPAPDRPRPRFALGFEVHAERAVEIARRWARSRGPFAHGGLKDAALERTRGIYLPAYLYSAAVRADWSASIGEDYTVVETYVTTDAKGRPVTRTRTRTETEWLPLAGSYESWLAEVVVSASRGLPNEELEAVEPYDLRALRRYRPSVVAGWIAEEPSIAREDCRSTAHAEATERLRADVAGFLPGDHQRDLRVGATVGEESIDLVLLPVWVFALRYDPEKEPLRLVINGQTGSSSGKVPISAVKVTLAVLVVLAVVAVIAVAASGALR